MSVFFQYLTWLIAWLHREFYVGNYFQANIFSSEFWRYCSIVSLSTVWLLKSILIPTTTPIPSPLYIYKTVLSSLKVGWKYWEISQWYSSGPVVCVFFFFLNPLHWTLSEPFKSRKSTLQFWGIFSNYFVDVSSSVGVLFYFLDLLAFLDYLSAFLILPLLLRISLSFHSNFLILT